jgi:hypothetical protein
VQCYNFQNFGHVWSNCRHPYLLVVCGAEAITTIKNALRRERKSQPPAAEATHWGEKFHPSNYRGCIYAKSNSSAEV